MPPERKTLSTHQGEMYQNYYFKSTSRVICFERSLIQLTQSATGGQAIQICEHVIMMRHCGLCALFGAAQASPD
jgi:hypothetical protein